jgi:hypothetical protein
MKAEFIDYLKSISLSKVLIDRITEIYENYQMLFPIEILDIFVCDYVKEDGSREYQSLWFFSDNYLLEAKEFVVKFDIDICPHKDSIYYINFEFQDFNFKIAEDRSRLRIYFEFGDDKACELKASRENCDYLMKIYRRFILPNFNSVQ